MSLLLVQSFQCEKGAHPVGFYIPVQLHYYQDGKWNESVGQ